MNFNTLSDAHLKNFQAMVAPDRFSAGDSILDLHARDQSRHPACRPEAVIWPQEAAEVAAARARAGAEILAATLRSIGVKAEALPVPDRESLAIGRRHTSGFSDLPEHVRLGKRLEQARRFGVEVPFGRLSEGVAHSTITIGGRAPMMPAEAFASIDIAWIFSAIFP